MTRPHHGVSPHRRQLREPRWHTRPYQQKVYIMSKVWFITGASKGFGREFALGALERGYKVVATARNTDTLSGLVEQYGDAVLPVELDVTNRDQVFAAVKSAHE